MNMYFGLKVMNLAHEKAEHVLLTSVLVTRANKSSCEGKELHPTLTVSFSASYFFF